MGWKSVLLNNSAESRKEWDLPKDFLSSWKTELYLSFGLAILWCFLLFSGNREVLFRCWVGCQGIPLGFIFGVVLLIRIILPKREFGSLIRLTTEAKHSSSRHASQRRKYAWSFERMKVAGQSKKMETLNDNQIAWNHKMPLMFTREEEKVRCLLTEILSPNAAFNDSILINQLHFSVKFSNFHTKKK